MTVSVWARTQKPREVECDLAVVGAGIAGLSAALEAGTRGLRAVVLERDTPGAGASGRNAGFLIRGAADNYAAARRDWGRDRARQIWALTEENHRDLLALGAGSLPSYRPIGSCVVALEAGELAQLEASRTLLEGDGFEAGWVAPGEIDDALWRTGRAVGGLLNPADAVCSPLELIGMLSAALPDRCTTLPGAEVIALEPDGPSGLVVRTAAHAVRAARAIVCTNAYASLLLPSFEALVRPRRGQMLQIESGGATLRHAYYANHGSEYFRPGPGETLLVGGCRTSFADREVGFEDRVTDEVQRALERFAADVLGLRGRVLARWAGTMGFSPDGLPLVGPVELPGAPPGAVWFCGGFTGHGMSMAHATAKRAVGAMLGEGDNPFPLDRAR